MIMGLLVTHPSPNCRVPVSLSNDTIIQFTTHFIYLKHLKMSCIKHYYSKIAYFMFLSIMFLSLNTQAGIQLTKYLQWKGVGRTLNSIKVFIQEPSVLYKYNIVAHELMRNGILVILCYHFNNKVFFIS